VGDAHLLHVAQCPLPDPDRTTLGAGLRRKRSRKSRKKRRAGEEWEEEKIEE
jgi:hypothetical protein